jgi:hypothetical protein
MSSCILGPRNCDYEEHDSSGCKGMLFEETSMFRRYISPAYFGSKLCLSLITASFLITVVGTEYGGDILHYTKEVVLCTYMALKLRVPRFPTLCFNVSGFG